MYSRQFFQTKLGHASMASISAMVLFVALATQMQASSATAFAQNKQAETPVTVEMA